MIGEKKEVQREKEKAKLSANCVIYRYASSVAAKVQPDTARRAPALPSRVLRRRCTSLATRQPLPRRVCAPGESAAFPTDTRLDRRGTRSLNPHGAETLHKVLLSRSLHDRIEVVLRAEEVEEKQMGNSAIALTAGNGILNGNPLAYVYTPLLLADAECRDDCPKPNAVRRIREETLTREVEGFAPFRLEGRGEVVRGSLAHYPPQGDAKWIAAVNVCQSRARCGPGPCARTRRGAGTSAELMESGMRWHTPSSTNTTAYPLTAESPPREGWGDKACTHGTR